ncbi:MAG: DUF11 domain-containing protein [Dehalococcoidia bacterium]|nr:DUF11 domain-containing protein [Dehalococcoidia bacterium]
MRWLMSLRVAIVAAILAAFGITAIVWAQGTPPLNGPDLAIQKVGVVSGQTVTYTLTITGVGTLPTSNLITVTDTLTPGSSGAVFVSATGPAGYGWTCTGAPGAGPVSCTNPASIGPGGLLTLTIVVNFGATGSTFQNCATVAQASTAATPADPNLANNSSCVTTTPSSTATATPTPTATPAPPAARPDLAIQKTGTVSGQTVTYTLTVTNVGGMPTFPLAGPISVTDTLTTFPAGSAFVSASGPGWTCTGAPGAGPVNCTYPNIPLAPGGPPLTITIVVTVPPGAQGNFENCATVSYPTNAAVPPESNLGNNTACITNTVGGSGGSITLVKDTQPDDAQDFTFTLTSSGPIQGATLDDDGNSNPLANTKTFGNLAAGTYTLTETAVSGWTVSNIVCTPSAGTTVSTAAGTATINLAAGANITCTFVNTKQTSVTTTYIYSVKYICGMVQPPGPKPTLPTLNSPFPVVPGVYRTAINVHNFMEQTVTITKKAVIALPQDEPRGAISRKVQDVLRDNEALEVDCQDVLKLLATVGVTINPASGFVTGFVEILSPVDLQVTAVYTMEELLEQGVSIDVEQIQPHVVNKS